jgi:hypothetical protein
MPLAPAPSHKILRAGPDFRWPQDKRIALVFNIA